MRYSIKIILVAVFGTCIPVSPVLAADDDWVLRAQGYSLSRTVLNQTLEARGFTPEKLTDKQRSALLQELFIRENLLLEQKKIPDLQLSVLEKKLDDYRQSQIAKLTLDVLSEVDMPDFSKRAEELYEVRKNEEYQLPLRLRVRILRQQFNEQNKEQVILALENILQKISSGDLDFKQAVLQNSDDPNKKLTEGDSFWFYQGQKPRAVYSAAEKLGAKQPLSNIIIYKNSAYILNFMGRQEPVLRPFSEVKNSIFDELKADYRNEQRKLLLSTLRDRFQNEVEIHPDFKK